MARIGRPPIYEPETGDKLCAHIATSSKSLRTICKMEGMPSVESVMCWIRTIPAFAEQYARSKQDQAEMMAEDMLQIADDGCNDTYVDENGNERVNNDVIQRSRLRVDTRKWLASKLLPKKYGDKVDVTSDGQAIKSGNPVQIITPANFINRRGVTHGVS